MNYRRLISVFSVVVVLASAPFVFAEAQPAYEAEVVGASAFALSGPGIGFYPTSTLRPGETVTVYGERSKHWVSILPPKGSFSWVLADAVEEKDDGTGRILEDGTKIRVGSSLTTARHVYQVTLNKGDKVQIIDHAFAADGAKIAPWFKILPPRDEVRYVAISQLKLPAGPVTAGLDGKLTSPVRPTPVIATSRPEPSKSAAEGSVTARPEKTNPDGVIKMVGNRVIPPAQPIRPGQSKSTSPLANASSETRIDDDDEEEGAPPVKFTDNSELPYGRRLKSLQSQLDLMRSREPGSWNVAEARDIFEKALQDAPSDAERDEALKSLAEVRRLEELKQRYLQSVGARERTLERDQELATTQQRKRRDSLAATPRFTTEGMLQPAAIRVDGQPTYTIKDSSGLATHYVVAVPGLNISEYVGKRVGLIGEVKKESRLPTPVLTVQQLAPLE